VTVTALVGPTGSPIKSPEPATGPDVGGITAETGGANGKAGPEPVSGTGAVWGWT
jgi:hypothetical protein